MYSNISVKSEIEKSGGNGDPEKAIEKLLFTAEPLRAQSLLFDLFSFERKGNK